ncbi:hypothetical protein [Streptomyces poriferorum]|uniref:Uncharacterized protein n=1 Tax=Streptomyces poriferorum TaxID=2798799 RepID=A0ABY9J411_9ACTN|nr:MULTISPECIES: hypothetical protein [unclassified Streptomyces]MDP5309377.1 hypothetical protein [Streptomyces sp. Alt4]WLQ61421.1 hypothetical protein P8A19_41140 [Streptomyces sp. Alt2]
MTTSPRTIMRIHFHVAEPAEGLYDQLLAVLGTITPRIEPHPADWSADLDLTGALRYWALLWGFRTCGVTSCSALR